MAARVGQDDFVIALPHLSYAPDAAIAVQGILDSVSQRRQMRKAEIEVDDGADLELFPVDGFESQGLLRPISAVQDSAFTYSGEAMEQQYSRDGGSVTLAAVDRCTKAR
jgi:hypothetical protein